MRLYNTRTRTKEDFEPLDPERVTMYVCGPTVYSYAHIGNARPAVVFDVLYRVLCRVYGSSHVVYARNITDVDDKIMRAAAEEGSSIDAVTSKYTRIYREDMSALGVLPPNLEPTVTGNMDAIVQMIARLVALGHAYPAEGHVLFEVRTFPKYGQLSGRSQEELLAGARVEVAPYKKDPGDFVLWKPSRNDQPGWESPWGRGRPGWHLECSAMIERHLGDTIDIHGGGIDLMFPHHENERAQSMCAHEGRSFVRTWMHNGFLQIDREKMSKSEGNVLLVHNLLEKHPGEAIRYTLLSAHYRQPLDWNQDALHQSQRNLDRLYRFLQNAEEVEDVPGEPADGVLSALHDDLNTPRALAELNELGRQLKDATEAQTRVEAKARLRASASLLGLLESNVQTWGRAPEASLDPDQSQHIEDRIRERAEARRARDFARADAIRSELLELGFELVDGPSGTSWKRVSP